MDNVIHDDKVEELAFLIKENLSCKHLVLSVEEALVDFLQDDTRSDGFIELEPMNSYERLLLHHLADIFGFAHESVGEKDDRHIILERCSETLIPPVLVSDILWQYDGMQYFRTPHQILRRKEASQVIKNTTGAPQYSLQEREAAGERGTGVSVEGNERQEHTRRKPRDVPRVSRRMIAHALGQKFNRESTVKPRSTGFEAHAEVEPVADLEAEARQETYFHGGRSARKKETGTISRDASSHNDENINSGACSGSTKEKDLGAAKRMLTHALGRQAIIPANLPARLSAAK